MLIKILPESLAWLLLIGPVLSPAAHAPPLHLVIPPPAPALPFMCSTSPNKYLPSCNGPCSPHAHASYSPFL